MGLFKGNKGPECVAEAKAELLAGKTAKGVDGQVEIDSDWLTIRRKGIRAKRVQGPMTADKRIPMDNITAVQLREPGLSRGYVRFTAFGDSERNRKFMAGITDENGVMFANGHLPEFLAIKEIIEDRVAQGGVSAPTETGSTDVVDQVERLAALRDKGVITEDQFSTQRGELLS